MFWEAQRVISVVKYPSWNVWSDFPQVPQSKRSIEDKIYLISGGLPGQRNNQTASSLLDCEYIWLSHMCYIIYTDTACRWAGMIVIEENKVNFQSWKRLYNHKCPSVRSSACLSSKPPSTLILHLSTFILHLSTFVIHISPFIILLSTFILHFETFKLFSLLNEKKLYVFWPLWP